MIGTEVVAKSYPDGHTLLMVSTSHATNPALVAKVIKAAGIRRRSDGVTK